MAITFAPSGKIVPKKFGVKKLERAAECNIGFCVACGAEKEACEPDARKYACEGCGKNLVFGAEEIALMGWTK